MPKPIVNLSRGVVDAWLQPFRGRGLRAKLGLVRAPNASPAGSPSPTPAQAWRPPPAPDDALDRIIAHAGAGDRETLARAIGALDAARYYDLDVLVAGIEVKARGYPDLALATFAALLRAQPDYAPAHYERAVVLRHFGRLAEAVEALREARRCKPDDFRAGLLLVQLLYGVSPDLAVQAAASVKPVDEDEARRLGCAAMEGAYLTEFPRERALALVGEVAAGYEWLDTVDVARAIDAAIQARRGFALIRLGDGEGAFARVDAADEARHAELYALYRREWTSFLLGEGFDPVATGYDALTATLMAVACEADILGVPYPSWIEHEYDILSPRTIACLVNVHRSLLSDPPARRPRVCAQLMHMYLFTSGEIEPIIRRARRASVITCLPDLAGRLRDRFELEDVEAYLVPSEAVAPHLRTDTPSVGTHFPGVYHDMIARLSRPHEGRLFLVAAGTLGKFYCATIKRHGGIALDVGSLVDAWMRLPSRLGYDDSLAL